MTKLIPILRKRRRCWSAAESPGPGTQSRAKRKAKSPSDSILSTTGGCRGGQPLISMLMKTTRRARTFAVSALETLLRNPRLYLILATSGSRGWHLFILIQEFYPVGDWTRFLKELTTRIRAPVRAGCCELFPNETRFGSCPYGIRAPGTWNPKTDQLGLIAFNSTGPLLEKLFALKGERKKEREKSPFPDHSSHGATGTHLNDSESFYSGGAADWQRKFAILHGGTRHEQLCELVHTVLRQVGCPVARWNAERQYLGSRIQPRATLAEHLEEFDELWKWNMGR